jgi:hypothetical protein
VVKGELLLFTATISALMPITNQDVGFAEWNAATIQGPNELNQSDDGRYPEQEAFGRTNDSLGIGKDLDLFFSHQTHGFFPVDKIQEGIISV